MIEFWVHVSQKCGGKLPLFWFEQSDGGQRRWTVHDQSVCFQKLFIHLWRLPLLCLSASYSLTQTKTIYVAFQSSSIPRINCLDCLDRTNVMMARISESFFISVSDHISTSFIRQMSKLQSLRKGLILTVLWLIN